jgi:dUTP pyrophosphatase
MEKLRVTYSQGVTTKLYKQFPENAGYDIGSNEDKVVKAGTRECIDTGVSCAIPKGFYGRIAPRSGLAVKHGINVLAGVADSNYVGILKVVLHNTSDKDFVVNKGDRIAQLIITPYLSPEIEEVSSLDETDRGDSGFGSSGV